MPEAIMKARPLAILGRLTRAQAAGAIILVGVSLDASSVRSAETAKLNPPTDRFHITAEEQAACGADAMELCSDTYPDEDKLLACMKSNRLNLSVGCRPVFEAGIKRRHL